MAGQARGLDRGNRRVAGYERAEAPPQDPGGDVATQTRPDARLEDRPFLTFSVTSGFAQGGGKIAAQACAGMPLNSTQGQN